MCPFLQQALEVRGGVLDLEGGVGDAGAVTQAVAPAAARDNTLAADTGNRAYADARDGSAVDPRPGDVAGSGQVGGVVAVDTAAARLKLALGVDAFQRGNSGGGGSVNEAFRVRCGTVLGSTSSNCGRAPAACNEISRRGERVGVDNEDTVGASDGASESDDGTTAARVGASRSDRSESHVPPVPASGEAGVRVGNNGGWNDHAVERNTAVATANRDLVDSGDVVLCPLDVVNWVDDAKGNKREGFSDA